MSLICLTSEFNTALNISPVDLDQQQVFTITTDLFRRFFLIQKVHFLESIDIKVNLNLFIKWIIMETIQHLDGNTSFFNSFNVLNSNLQGIKLFNQFYFVSIKVPLCSQLNVGLLYHFCEIKLLLATKFAATFLHVELYSHLLLLNNMDNIWPPMKLSAPTQDSNIIWPESVQKEFDCTMELYLLPIKLLLTKHQCIQIFHNYTKVVIFARKAYIRNNKNSLSKKWPPLGMEPGSSCVLLWCLPNWANLHFL